MKIRIEAIVILGAALIPGCGGAAVPVEQQAITKGPHGGTAHQLPEKKGFVELVNEPEPRDRRGDEPTSLVAYFLKLDGKSPLEPPPSDVSFTIESGAGGRGKAASQAVPLAPEPKSDDPAGAGRFASKPGPYILGGIRGTLNAKVDGQGTSVAFAGGR